MTGTVRIDRSGRALGIGLAMVVLWCPKAAAEDGESVTSSLVYRAPEGCPGSDEFTDWVRARLRRTHLVNGEGRAPDFSVTLTEVENGASGILAPLRAAGEARRVIGESCEQAARAMALVTALALDARVNEAEPEANSELQPAEPPPRQAETAVLEPPPRRVEREDQLATRSLPSRPASRGPAWTVGARGWVDTPKAPHLLPGADLYVELGVHGRLALQLAAGLQRGPRSAAGAGSARFSWMGARATAYYLLTASGARLAFEPGLFAEAGVLHAEGFVEQPRNVNDAAAALGSAFRLSYVTTPLRMSLEAGGAFQLNHRDQYVFGSIHEPESVVFDVPLFGFFMAAGFGLPLQ